MSIRKMIEIGEKAFLKELLPQLAVHPSFVNGFGHDASVIDIGFPSNLVMKIDRAAKPIAAINGWCDYRLWGRLAVTANCSDILAAGGAPKGLMLAISAPANSPVSLLTDIVHGAAEVCLENDIAFIGGDTKEAAEANVVGAAVGIVAKGKHFDRRKGRSGDRLVLAGSLGGYVGAYWQCMNRNTPSEAISYLSYPRARWREASALSVAPGVHSACDLSDGLIDALQSLLGEGLGAVIRSESLPYHPLAIKTSRETGTDILNYALGVGDWGIVYAVSPECSDLIESLRANGLELFDIGKIVERHGILFDLGDSLLQADLGSANEHFRSRMEDQGNWFAALMSGSSFKPLDSAV